MDQKRFDALTRSVASPRSRRGFLGAVAALAAGLAAGRTADAQTSARCGNVPCASNPGVCAAGCVCCAYANGNSRCLAATARCTGTVATATTAAPATTSTSTSTSTTTGTATTQAPTTTTTTTTAALATTTTPAPTTTAEPTTTTTTTTTVAPTCAGIGPSCDAQGLACVDGAGGGRCCVPVNEARRNQTCDSCCSGRCYDFSNACAP